VSSVDYAAGLAQVAAAERQLIVCAAVRPSPFPCLGFLNRRLLWAQAQRGDVYVELSHCAACRPAVYDWLRQEIAAANAALTTRTSQSATDTQDSARPRIHIVRLKGERPAGDKPLLEKGVSRRGIFAALLHAARDKVEEVEQRNAAAMGVRFDSTDYVVHQVGTLESSAIPALFYGLQVSRRCNVCGLCASVCPENALRCSWSDKNIRFSPLACTGCGLCVNTCGQDALTLLDAFAGETTFYPRQLAAEPVESEVMTLPDTDATDMEEESAAEPEVSDAGELFDNDDADEE